MANEFVIKNGFISNDDSMVSGRFTATTISATTYLNIPVSNFTGGTVNGDTIFQNGLTATTVSATTYLNLPTDIYTTGFTFNLANYDLTISRNGGLSDLTESLAILASDLRVTGGTYDPNTGVATFTNNSGGTFDVSGFTSGLTDTIITDFNYNPSENTFTINQSNGSAFTATINVTTGLTVNGILSATTISANTIGSSGDCVDDIYISNIHSCSPLNINPNDEGNVYFGSTSGVTIDLANNRIGIGITEPTAKLHINNTITGATFLAEDSTNPDTTPFIIDASGNTGIGTLTPLEKLQIGDRWTFHDGGNKVIGFNSYFTSGIGDRRVTSGSSAAIRFQPNEGRLLFNTAISGDSNQGLTGSTPFSWFTPLTISSSFSGSVGINTATPSATLQVIPADGRTIAGSNLSGSTLLVGTTVTGIGIDNNEIYKAGSDSPFIIGTLGSSNIDFRPSGTTQMVVSTRGLTGQQRTSPNSYLSGFFLDTHPEATGFNPVIIPFINNDIAYCTLRGGTCTLTPGPGSTLTWTDGVIQRLFNGAPDYLSFDPISLSGSLTVDIVFPQEFTYINTIGFSFGNDVWRAKDFTVEIRTGGTYTIINTQTEYPHANYSILINVFPSTLQGIRLTFSNFATTGNTTGFRIADIFVQNFNGQAVKQVFVGRDGGDIFAPIRLASGSTSATSYSTISDTNTGIYFPAPDNIGFVEGGIEVIRINDSGNVGIGTTTPTQKLDVNGTSIFRNTVNILTGTTILWQDKSGIFPTSVNNRIRWDLNNDAADIYAQQRTSDALDLTFRLTDNNSIDSFVFWVDNGAATDEILDSIPLQMDGQRVVVNALRRYATSATTSGSGNVDFYILRESATTLNDSAMFVDVSTGNVGIGTTSPTQRLDVNGSSIFRGNVNMLTGTTILWDDGSNTFPTSVNNRIRWRLNNDAAEIYAHQRTSDALDLTFRLTDNNSIDSFVFWVDNGTTADEIFDSIPLQMDGQRVVVNALRRYATSATTSGSGNVDFFILKESATTLNDSAMFVDVSTGNVGIGISTPTAELHINNTGTTNSFLVEDSTNPDASPFVIDASGNTGIGTTSPIGKLNIIPSGTIAVELSGFSNAGIVVGNTTNGMAIDANEVITIGGGLVMGTLDSTSIGLRTDSIQRVTIRENGDVGIGITEPTAKLHINNTTTGATFLAEDSTNPDSSPFIIDASGNTGIGTTTPITPLHISNTGLTVSTSLISPLAGADMLTISTQNTAPGINIISASNSQGHRGVFKATRSRGTLSSPTVPSTGDDTFSLLGAIYDGVTNLSTAGITMEVDGVVTANTAPQRIIFETGTGSSRTERMRITSDGNVGIGTTNPTSFLHVNSPSIPSTNETIVRFTVGDAPSSYLDLRNGTLVDGQFVAQMIGRQVSGNSQPAFYVDGGIDSTEDAGGTPITIFRAFKVSGSTLSPLSARTLFDFRNWTDSVMTIDAIGEVGIGITTPTAKLHVNNTGTTNSFLVEDSTNPDASPFVIDASGNTGIGAQSFGNNTKLYVYKGATTANGLEEFNTRIETDYLVEDTNLKQGLRLQTTARQTGTTSFVVGLLSLARGINSGTTSAVTSLWSRIDSESGHTIDNAYNIEIRDGLGNGTINNHYGLYVRPLSKGVSNNFAIYTSGDTKSYFGGNVGIGTTVPSFLLDVANQEVLGTLRDDTQTIARFRGRVGGTGGTNSNSFRILSTRLEDYSNNDWSRTGLRLESLIDGDGVSNSWIEFRRPTFSSLNNQIAFGEGTGTTNTWMIIDNGNVGIGITTPTAELHVNNTGTTNSFLVEDSTNPDASPFVIDASGNTGIGTLTPIGKLNITHSNTIGSSSLGITNSAIFINSNVNTDRYMAIDSNEILVSGATFVMGTLDNEEISLRTNGTQKLTIRSNGDVGIGITVPTAKLHVNNTGTTNSFLVEDSANPDVTPFIIDASGNTGIGTLTPTQRLDVNGQSIFRGDVNMLTGTTILWQDKSGIFPTSVNNRIRWDLNSDAAEIYAYQVLTTVDVLDLVFKISDNTTTDSYVFWIDDFKGESDDSYPLQMDGQKAVFNALRRYATSATTSGSGNVDFYILRESATTLNDSAMFVDVSTGNVGIGTSSPTNLLHVSATTNPVRFEGLQSGNTDTRILTSDSNGVIGYRSLSSSYTTTGITISSQTLTTSINYYGVSYNGNVNLTLPSPVNNDGTSITIKDEGGYSGNHRIRLIPPTGTIDGGSYADMNTNYISLTLIARNNNWWII